MSQARQFDQSPGRQFVQSPGRQRNRIPVSESGVVVVAGHPFFGLPPINIYDWIVLYGEENPINPGYPQLFGDERYDPLPSTRWLKGVTRITYGEGATFVGWVETTAEYSPKYGDLIHYKVENFATIGSYGGVVTEMSLGEDNVVRNSGNGVASDCDNIPTSAPAFDLVRDPIISADHYNESREGENPAYYWEFDTLYTLTHTRAEVEALARGLIGAFPLDSYVRLSSTLYCEPGSGDGERVWVGLDNDPAGTARRIASLALGFQRGCENNIQRRETAFANVVSANVWYGGTLATSDFGGRWFSCIGSPCNGATLAAGRFRSGGSYASVALPIDERFPQLLPRTCGTNYPAGVTTNFPVPGAGQQYLIKHGSCPPTT